MAKQISIFSTKSYQYMADLVHEVLPDARNREIERKSFPDGERYLRMLPEHIEGQDVLLVGGMICDSDVLEIFDLSCACVKYGAKRLTLMIPYFGYSTMERATKGGEVVVAKTRARLLSAIPKAPSGNHILLLDLHSEGIAYYFEGDATAKHIYAKDAVKRLILKATLAKTDFVLGSTDAGRAKWVESLAHDMGVTPAFCYKQRLSGEETRLTGVNADVKGKDVVIYDDMIRTGGSAANAATAYLSAGAKSVSLIVTHGLFLGNCLNKLKAAGVTFFGSTDSHPLHRVLLDLAPQTFAVESVSKIMIEKSFL